MVPYEISYGRRLLDRGRRRRSGDHGGTVAFSDVPILAHLDLDAFFAAVEELEDPSLRTQPLVVGGNPQGRGVVATANYVARRFGIRSAMSSAEALRRCPDVVFIRPRHALYRQYSEAVWGAVREVVPRVEQVGIDEGYLDIGTVTSAFTGARAVAEAVQTSVRAATSLSCSLGVSTSKVVCKVASDRRKPGGITVVPPGKEARFLAPFPVRALPGVGPEGGAATRGSRRHDGGRSRRSLRLPSSASCCRGRSARSCATAPAGSTRATSSSRPSASRSRSRRRSSGTSRIGRSSTPRSSGWPPRCPQGCVRRQLSARTVTTKLRYRRLLDQEPLDDAQHPDRRGGADRGARLPAPRPWPARPAGGAAARRRRRLRAVGAPAADARRAVSRRCGRPLERARRMGRVRQVGPPSPRREMWSPR